MSERSTALNEFFERMQGPTRFPAGSTLRPRPEVEASSGGVTALFAVAAMAREVPDFPAQIVMEGPTSDEPNAPYLGFARDEGGLWRIVGADIPDNMHNMNAAHGWGRDVVAHNVGRAIGLQDTRFLSRFGAFPTKPEEVADFVEGISSGLPKHVLASSLCHGLGVEFGYPREPGVSQAWAKAVVAAGIDIDAPVPMFGGRAPLDAYVFDHVNGLGLQDDTVVALVEAGASVDLPGPDGFTPLMTALTNGSFGTASFLMEKGASPTTTSTSGFTASDCLVLGLEGKWSGDIADTVRRMVDAGANVVDLAHGQTLAESISDSLNQLSTQQRRMATDESGEMRLNYGMGEKLSVVTRQMREAMDLLNGPSPGSRVA